MDLDPYKTPETEFEAKEGYHFVFKFGSRIIEAWGTGFSGKEYVTVDGELKSEKRTHAKTSIHNFECDGDLYEIEFKVKNILSGVLICTLKVNEAPIQKFRAKPKAEFNIVSFVFIMAFFFSYGFVESYFNLPNWLFYLLLVVLFVSSTILAKKNIEVTEIDKA